MTPVQFVRHMCRAAGVTVEDFSRLQDILERVLQPLTRQDSVTAIDPQNGWANLSTSQAVGYWRDSHGIVHLCGIVAGGTPGASSVIMTLPDGYRPGGSRRFAVASNLLFGQCTVETTGEVIARVGSGVSFCLDGVSFRAER